MVPDILLLTEEDFSPERNWLHEVNSLLGLTGRSVRLPHDIHMNTTLLASVLLREGFTCELADNFLHLPPQTERFERLLSHKPRVVGLSTTFLFSEDTVRDITRRIRALSPDSLIVLGGPSMLQFPEWRRYGDIAVLYDGELTLASLLKTLKSGGSLRDIPGIEFEEGGRRVLTAPAEFTPMSELPFPDWGHGGRGRRGVYPLETQRGCVYKCKFCTHPIYSPGAKGERQHPISRIMEELRNNYERWGITCYRFIDSTFTFPPKRAEQLCREMIRLKLPLRWSCYGRTDNMNPGLAGAMAEAGCRCIFFGIESGDNDMLKRMRKDFTIDEVHAGLDIARRHGIASMGSFVIGYPGETELSVGNTEQLILQAGFSLISAGPFWLDHNSPAWDLREEYRLSGRADSWSHKTMDSKQAAELTGRLLRDVLMKNAARLGLDFMLASAVGLGLEYDEALSYMLSKGLLVNLRLAKAAQRPLDCFDAAEVRTARSRYEALAAKIAGFSRRYWAEPIAAGS